MMDSFTVNRLKAILNGYIDQKVPGDLRLSVRVSYRMEHNQVTLIEEWSEWHDRKWLGTDFAQFRWENDKWRVYSKKENNEWSQADSIIPHEDFERQLEQVELDSERIFWIS
jgi:hypothetical protein